MVDRVRLGFQSIDRLFCGWFWPFRLGHLASKTVTWLERLWLGESSVGKSSVGKTVIVQLVVSWEDFGKTLIWEDFGKTLIGEPSHQLGRLFSWLFSWLFVYSLFCFINLLCWHSIQQAIWLIYRGPQLSTSRPSIILATLVHSTCSFLPNALGGKVKSSPER